MIITENQWVLAHRLLSMHKRLSGIKFTENDVQRIAEGIARRSWLEKQLASCQTPHS